MRSAVTDTLPPKVGRSLGKLGADLRDARRKRHLTVAMMVERVGVSKATYQRVEKGDPSVSMGVYAMALFVLGFPSALGEIADSRRDDTGLLLDARRLPQRIRPKKAPEAP
ncbi:MAG: helix-turn-helix transcriptional regulator [Xanthomonadales bacterium]|nr:helix-turn-helix transcriptional regulator [Xanthomonadales bacterium]MCC6561736.1 helix-turn-helix transcriptional regulator [Xanthomonadales bacterium]